MKNELLLLLVLPLLFIALFGLSLNYFYHIDGFYVNLATEIIGIVITVGYVDWVIRRLQTQQWQEAEEKISFRLQHLINATISSIRAALGYSIDIMDSSKLLSGDIGLAQQELIRIAENILEPTAQNRIESLDVQGWKTLIKYLKSIWEETDRLLITFGSKLKPDQYTNLLEIQDKIQSIITQYSTFPDIAGVPDKDLPSSKTPAKELRREINESVAKDLKGLLVAMRTLASIV